MKRVVSRARDIGFTLLLSLLREAEGMWARRRRKKIKSRCPGELREETKTTPAIYRNRSTLSFKVSPPEKTYNRLSYKPLYHCNWQVRKGYGWKGYSERIGEIEGSA